MNPKVLLLEPLVTPSDRWGSFKREKGTTPPIGLLSIYAYLKEKGIDISIFDSQIESSPERKIAELLSAENYDIIGIPVFTNTAHHSFYTARFCKNLSPDSLIVLGNVHVSALPARSLMECKSADICVIGEGEITMEEVIQNYDKNKKVYDIKNIKGIAFRQNDKILINEKRERIQCLDELPSIYRHYQVDRYVPAPNQYRKLPSVPFMTQRGCPFRCTFCEVHLIHGRKVRYKTVDYAIDELKYLKRKYNIKSVYFQDSTFTINKRYTLSLCDEIKKNDLNIEWSCSSRVDTIDLEMIREMRAAGCWQICYGVESGNQDSLEVLNKGGRNTLELIEERIAQTKENGIRVLGSFILGIPGEDERMVRNTIAFARKLAPHTALFFLPVPYPGSELYEICRRSGGLREDAKWSEYLAIDFDNPVYVNPLLGKNKMRALYHQAFISFYLDPRIWWTNLRTIENVDDVKRYLKGGNALFGFLQHVMQSRN